MVEFIVYERGSDYANCFAMAMGPAVPKQIIAHTCMQPNIQQSHTITVET